MEPNIALLAMLFVVWLLFGRWFALSTLVLLISISAYRVHINACNKVWALDHSVNFTNLFCEVPLESTAKTSK